MSSWEWGKPKCCNTVQKGQVGKGICVAVTDSGSWGQGKILSENVTGDKDHCEKADVHSWGGAGREWTEVILQTSRGPGFHNHFLGLLNALINSPEVFSFITDKSPVQLLLKLFLLNALFYFLPNLSCVTSPSVVRGKVTFVLVEYALNLILHLFYCSVVLLWYLTRHLSSFR